MGDFHAGSDGNVGDCGVLYKDRRRQGLELVALQGGRGLRNGWGGFAESKGRDSSHNTNQFTPA